MIKLVAILISVLAIYGCAPREEEPVHEPEPTLPQSCSVRLEDGSLALPWEGVWVRCVADSDEQDPEVACASGEIDQRLSLSEHDVAYERHLDADPRWDEIECFIYRVRIGCDGTILSLSTNGVDPVCERVDGSWHIDDSNQYLTLTVYGEYVHYTRESLYPNDQLCDGYTTNDLSCRWGDTP